MASLLNNASLLLNPAGSIIAYEEDKIFSVLPSNGTGDFTFSGGDGGTRVNQQGYVEVTPANLFTYSNDFTNAIWGTAGYGNKATITPNALPNPVSGVLDASLTNFISSGTQGRLLQVKTGLQVGIPYTVSMYVKAGTKSSVVVYVDTAVFGYNANFNLSTGTITSTYGTTATIKLVDNGWYYITVTCPVLPSGNMQYGIITNGSDDGTLYLYGAMLNQGSTAKPYQPTTDRLNYPRITYQNGRGALLSELQRTNQLLYSNKFDEVNWEKVNVGVTASAAISPDGTSNAWAWVPNSTSGQHYILQDSTVTSGTKYVQTIFAKAGGYQWLQFAPSNGFNSSYVNFNLANGTVGTNTSGFLATITPFKDGWYRCSLACTSTNTGTGRIVIAPIQSDSQGRLPTWAGDGTSGIYIYGAQLESGGHPSIVVNIDYPTSYIPTTSATVSRPGDVAIDSSVSSLVSQNDGTLYISGVPLDQSQEFIALTPSGYTLQNIVLCYFNAGTTLSVRCYANSSLITNGTLNIPLGSYFKAAIRYKNGDSAVYINGQQRTTNNTAFSFTGTLNQINIQSNAFYFVTPGSHGLSTVATYTTGLTNTQLAELTTINSGSGGNISYYGPYTIHTFTGSATFTPSFTGQVEVLVVAGGGGGGNNHAGGGGAGGLLYTSAYGVSAGTGITVTIGAGGTSPVSNPDPVTNGSNSVFGGLTAIGGGGGGNRNDFNNNSPGGNGGSGGGGGGSQAIYPGNWVPGNGVLGQGNNGGTGIDIYGGGGGGAGAVGTIGAASSSGGNGGNGLPYSISGFSTYYAGGGGGGYCPIAGGGNGGLGGGGKGGILITDKGTPGIPYTGAGGGGGGAGGTQGSIGGAGIVIVRYLT